MVLLVAQERNWSEPIFLQTLFIRKGKTSQV